MKISFVLPVYNCASFLAQTIDSLIGQSSIDQEIIIIDDCSTDDIEPLKKHYNKCKWLVTSKRMGAAYCRNLGNAQATGDVIACCDAGDINIKSRGKEIIEYLEKHPEIDIVYSHVQVNSPMHPNPVAVQEAETWDGTGKPPISHPTVAYRKCVTNHKEVRDHENKQLTGYMNGVAYHSGSLDTDFYEFFMHDAYRIGYKFDYIPRILVMKFELSGMNSYRDVKKSKDEKYKKYQEYGIEIERANV